MDSLMGQTGMGQTWGGAQPEVLGHNEHRTLARVLRLLVGVHRKGVFARARAHGYSEAEHAEGWRLFRLACGEASPLDAAAEPARDARAVLRALDAFENLWFPRVRAVLARTIAPPRAEAFLASFFAELTQQPAAPAVALSVRTLLARIDGLATSAVPGALEAHAALEARGLTAAKVAEVRALLDALEKPEATPADRARAAAEADRARREALRELRAWFRDWSTTLRTEFDAPEQIVLGLKRVARRGGATSEEEAGP